MRRLPFFVAILLAASLTSCATRVDVEVHEDLAPYGTWSWLPRAVPKVHAPHRRVGSLETELARFIDAELSSRGYRRIEHDPDFFVVYQLVLERQTVLIDQPQASYDLSTHTSDGVFQIEGSEKVSRTYEQFDLAVGITDAQGRTLWHARLTDQSEDSLDLDLESAVAKLLEKFPQHRPPGGH